MMKYNRVLLLLQAICVCVIGASIDYADSSNFCIRNTTEINSDLRWQNCGITVNTLTNYETETVLKTMCDELKDHAIPYYYFRIRNGNLTGHALYTDFCQTKPAPMFTWLPFNILKRHYFMELNPMEQLNYIGKVTDLNGTKLELCHFQHVDLVSNRTSSQATCTNMISQDTVYALSENIEVLMEIQPISYELRNLSYSTWSKVVPSYKVMLGDAKLINIKRTAKKIFGSLNFNYPEQLKLDLNSIYGNKLEKLPLSLNYKERVLTLDENGATSLKTNDTAYFGHVLEPESTIQTSIIGERTYIGKEFSADVYENFGCGIQRLSGKLEGGLISFVRITNTEAVFPMPELQVFKKLKHKHSHERLVEDESDIKLVEDEADYYWPEKGHPYPDFFKYSIPAGLVIGIAFLAAIGCMVHTYSKEHENVDKQGYKLARSSNHN